MSTQIETADKIDRLLDLLTTRRDKPVYIRISERPNGTMDFHQVEFLTTDEFAALCRVDRRTVYSWKDRGIGPKWFQPEGTGSMLCDLKEAIDFIRSEGAYAKPENN